MNRINETISGYKERETEHSKKYQKGVWYYTEDEDYPNKPNLCIRCKYHNGDEYIGYTEWYEPSEDEIGYGGLVLDIVSNGESLIPSDIDMWCIIDKPPKSRNELKPCPFCGSKAVEIRDTFGTINGESYKGKTVLCNFDKGGCGAECGIRKTEADAIEAWNRRVFNDIHKDTASAVFGTPKNEVTSDQKNVAKAINFGVTYGRAEWQKQSSDV